MDLRFHPVCGRLSEEQSHVSSGDRARAVGSETGTAASSTLRISWEMAGLWHRSQPVSESGPVRKETRSPPRTRRGAFCAGGGFVSARVAHCLSKPSPRASSGPDAIGVPVISHKPPIAPVLPERSRCTQGVLALDSEAAIHAPCGLFHLRDLWCHVARGPGS